MPASQATEESILEYLLAKKELTAIKAFLGLSTLKPSQLTKIITAKEFGEKEPTEANGWVRVELDTIEWEKTKGEGETGFTKWVNKNAIKGAGGAGEFKKLTAGEYLLETVAILPLAKQSEDATSKISAFGKLTTKITINSASTLEVAAKAIEIEVE
jgi:hypothetical protein